MNTKTIFRRLILVASLATAVGTLSGCAYFQVGEEDFSCSGMPDSVFCHSTRDVYEATSEGAVPSPMHNEDAYNEDCTDCKKSHLDGGPTVLPKEGSAEKGSEGASDIEKDEVIENYVTVALPERPIPIRTPSQVMRIWISPFIDSNGDYNAPGYIYSEIEPRRWVLAKEQKDIDRVLTPLAHSSEPVEEITAKKERSTEKTKQ